MGWDRVRDTDATLAPGLPGQASPLSSPPARTVFVKEEEEEGVHDGDEDPTPEGDAAGWQGGGISCVPLGRAGPLWGLGWSLGGGSPAGREQAEGDGCPDHLLHVGANDGDLDHEPEQHAGHLEGPGHSEMPKPTGGLGPR